jgi:SAM-dependent methyltransferase
MEDARRSAPAVQRNREPILQVLRRVLPDRGLVLEVASGTGEHAAFFAAALPHLVWQPSDPASEARASIAERCAGLPTVRRPLALDAAADPWPIDAADAIVCINMIHIAPWAACEGLLRGASRTLRPGKVLVLYGPYRVGGAHTAPSNAAFDEGLRAQDPAWGVRDLESVVELAGRHGLAHRETVAMPANNLTVVFERAGACVRPPPMRS